MPKEKEGRPTAMNVFGAPERIRPIPLPRPMRCGWNPRRTATNAAEARSLSRIAQLLQCG